MSRKVTYDGVLPPFDSSKSVPLLPLVKVPFVRSAYNYDRDAASDECGLRCDDPSLAKQEFKDDADINVIVRRFNVTGQLPQGVVAPVYQDFEGVFDFQSAMNVLAGAESAFMAMPAEVRYRFHNNPQEFVDFCSDDANRAEAERLGLVFRRAEGSAPSDGVPPSGGVPGEAGAPSGGAAAS